jgi:CheY-like chemotaxis protein
LVKGNTLFASIGSEQRVNVRAGGFARRSSREGAKTRCVLVVDDHSLFRQVLGIVLKGRAGLDTVQSGSVGEALRVLGNRADNDLALAIVDLDIPDVDKTALIEELRRSRVPVLALTGSHDPVRSAWVSGSGEVLTTAASCDEILAMVRGLLSE